MGQTSSCARSLQRRSQRHHGWPAASQAALSAGEGCREWPSITAGEGIFTPVPRPRGGNLPQGSHLCGRTCLGHNNTPAKSSLLTALPTAAWASAEHTPGPAQELRSNPGTHSTEATKQFSHKNILISSDRRAFFLPRRGQPGAWGLCSTATAGGRGTHQHLRPKIPARQRDRARARPATCRATR